MTTGALPEEARRRRMILVIGDNEYDGVAISTAGENLVRDDTVSILRWPLDAAAVDGSATLTRLDQQGLLELNAVLLQSPYDPQRYLTAAGATAAIARAKLLTTVELCRRLGASRVAVDEIRISMTRGTAMWNAEVSGQVMGATAETARAELETFVERTRLADEFPGGPADVDDAAAFLQDSGLAADDDLAALIRARTGRNPITSRHFHLTTSAEVSRIRRRLVQVRAVPLGVSGGIEQADESSAIYDFDLTVAFGRG